MSPYDRPVTNSEQPVIIEVAINGLKSKRENPNVPVEPAEIAADALACVEAGAAIVHNHIDRYGLTEQEAADRYLEGWRPVLDRRPDALLYPTIHYSDGLSYEHQVPLAASGLSRVGIVDPGSDNERARATTLYSPDLPGFPPAWLEDVLIQGRYTPNMGFRDGPWHEYAQILVQPTSADALRVLRSLSNAEAR